MSDKTIVMLATGLGSAIGGYLPSLWGASIVSGWSIILATVGGILGLWLGLRLVRS
jgi:hypothetical protein